MTTTQNDKTSMSEEQLDTVAAGAAFIKFDGIEYCKSSPKYRVILSDLVCTKELDIVGGYNPSRVIPKLELSQLVCKGK